MTSEESKTDFVLSMKSCNAENDAGKVLDAYTRVAPANYCNGQDSKRCKAKLFNYHNFKGLLIREFFEKLNLARRIGTPRPKKSITTLTI